MCSKPVHTNRIQLCLTLQSWESVFKPLIEDVILAIKENFSEKVDKIRFFQSYFDENLQIRFQVHFWSKLKREVDCSIVMKGYTLDFERCGSQLSVLQQNHPWTYTLRQRTWSPQPVSDLVTTEPSECLNFLLSSQNSSLLKVTHSKTWRLACKSLKISLKMISYQSLKQPLIEDIVSTIQEFISPYLQFLYFHTVIEEEEVKGHVTFLACFERVGSRKSRLEQKIQQFIVTSAYILELSKMGRSLCLKNLENTFCYDVKSSHWKIPVSTDNNKIDLTKRRKIDLSNYSEINRNSSLSELLGTNIFSNEAISTKQEEWISQDNILQKYEESLSQDKLFVKCEERFSTFEPLLEQEYKNFLQINSSRIFLQDLSSCFLGFEGGVFNLKDLVNIARNL